jgi:hypothetical protein
MSYLISDTVFDEALNYLKNNVTKVVLCDGAPANYSDANTANGSGSGQKIAEVTVDSSDLTVGNGATDGRKVTCGAQSGISVGANGDADHIAWLDVSNTALLAVTELSTARNGLTTSDTVDIGEHFIAIRDAAVAT